MASDVDPDSMLSAEGLDALLPSADGMLRLATARIIGRRMSADGQKLILTQEIVIDIADLRRLTREEQYRQQARSICELFARYIDRQKMGDLCQCLTGMLLAGNIEWLYDADGQPHVNILQGSGQAPLIRVLLAHMTTQKQSDMHQSKTFNDFKRLFISGVRHRGRPITANSLSNTLRRAVESL